MVLEHSNYLCKPEGMKAENVYPRYFILPGNLKNPSFSIKFNLDPTFEGNYDLCTRLSFAEPA